MIQKQVHIDLMYLTMQYIKKKLDLLIVGHNKPTKKKIDKAKELKVKILLEKEWKKILDS